MVGVGAMGSALSARLVDRGHEVLGVDPFLAPAGEPVRTEDGILVVNSIAEAVASGADIVDILVFVRFADQVVDVLSAVESEPTLAGLPVAVLSTLSVTDARSISERFSATRPYTEAPVSGGVAGARAGTLTVLVAGDDRPWIEDVAATVFRFPQPGLPAAAKLLNNAIAAANANALAAGLAHAGEIGLDARQLLEVVKVSSGGGWIAEHFEEFPVDLLWKDYLLMQESGRVTFPETTSSTSLASVVADARSLLND